MTELLESPESCGDELSRFLPQFAPGFKFHFWTRNHSTGSADPYGELQLVSKEVNGIARNGFYKLRCKNAEGQLLDIVFQCLKSDLAPRNTNSGD